MTNLIANLDHESRWFNRCETEFHSTKSLNLTEYDDDLRGAPPSKCIGPLGTLTTQNNMEPAIIESSSGHLKEHVTHSIEDSLKTLECKTFKKLRFYSVHVIKTQATLLEMSLSDKDHWKFAEKRSSTLPTDWNDRVDLLQYLELLVSLFDSVVSTQHVQKDLLKEYLGLVAFDDPNIE
ncbi:hypothetical protein BCV72DRAFT_335513 [Rhizopus microsporus var. microsporus]|uniref:Uncharacterized protein n=2 Tax=Rhizopus microsporus TaxID=58291 RepID=A0A2G4SSL0_RHIZD|nr:uncharacterized protein RHIMIDRAFT_292624 [Rhizopus microsporus ATCC 52813]ORE07010.1 hypothetical protein BCV72DRAFT_335513 [Rhizopus microsporus var. microsporus]PHZ11732.1 hypothetical protein RHIMIDRAFT_292624 [Rhizopus microsporus ATCC 52813]